MLSPGNEKAALKKRTRQYFYRKVKKKAITATIACFAGFGLILLVATPLGFLNLWTILGVIAAAVVTEFMVILRIFPTKVQADESLGLMLRAIDDPSIITASSLAKVTLDAGGGKLVTLEPVFLDVWVHIIAPHLFSNHTDTLKEIRRNSARVQRNSQISKKEIKDKLLDLRRKQEKISAEERKLKDREDQVNDAESLLVDQLNEIERTQEELIVMRQSIEEDSQAGDDSSRLAELEAKEASLAKMEAQLRADRANVDAQKTELNQLKGEHAQHGSMNNDEVLALKERIAELEAANDNLEERSAYVQSVEDQLIDQLNALTEREAAIEQKEADAGLRDS